MRHSNLDLLKIRQSDGEVKSLRYVDTMFPGALPYVRRHYYGMGTPFYHASLDEATSASGVSSWYKKYEGVWASRSEECVVSFGAEDWPIEETQKRVVLVGELNPYQDHKDFDLYDLPERASGHRLREMILGISREDYYRRFYRRNLCVGKWSLPVARRRAYELCAKFPKHTLVLLGRKVQAAFGFFTYPLPFECLWSPKSDTMLWPDRFIVRLPHPSGLCREWSDPTAFVWARDALRTAGVFCKSE